MPQHQQQQEEQEEQKEEAHQQSNMQPCLATDPMSALLPGAVSSLVAAADELSLRVRLPLCAACGLGFRV
jgi:hypothetical protein